MISAVVLAAGRSGDQNIFSPLEKKPLLQWVLESALASDLDEIICVTRDLAAVRREIKLANRRLCWLVNSAADRGQSTSVIAGLWASNPQSQGVMFLAGDRMPVRAELINLLIAKFERCPASIVAPGFASEPRSPALFRRDLFPELLNLTGDRSGCSLLERHPEKIVLVEWQEEISFLAVAESKDRKRLNPSD
ncbi:MAG: nucleotidyltransferase family protein [Candidatus Binatia bacterium]